MMLQFKYHIRKLNSYETMCYYILIGQERELHQVLKPTLEVVSGLYLYEKTDSMEVYSEVLSE